MRGRQAGLLESAADVVRAQESLVSSPGDEMLREVAGRIGPAGGGAVGTGIGGHERPFTNDASRGGRTTGTARTGRRLGWGPGRSPVRVVVRRPHLGPSTPPDAGRPCPCPCQCNFASATEVARTT